LGLGHIGLLTTTATRIDLGACGIDILAARFLVKCQRFERCDDARVTPCRARPALCLVALKRILA
jgi:hypothetical protein